MKLFVGLGNRGEEYQNNRHNTGYMMIDFMINQFKNEKLVPSEAEGSKMKSYNQKLKYDQYINADIGIYEMNNEKVILIKPQTFMNQSGDAVKACVVRYSSDVTNDLFIIHDDLDITLGEYKIQKGKGPKLHNGIVSIENALATSDFWRIRIGIDNREKEHRTQGETYVLQDFFREEKERLGEVFTYIFDAFRYPKAQ